MPSPFPDVDPLIEGQDWEDFHLDQHLSDALAIELLLDATQTAWVHDVLRGRRD